MMDDSQLVAGCIRGDTRARHLFLDQYSRLIYSYIKAVTIHKGSIYAQHHIQDIVHDVFCCLFADNARKLRSFRAKNGCTLASWLRQVTVNYTIDYIRALKHETSLHDSVEEEVALGQFMRAGVPAVVQSLLAEERLERLKDCIDALDAKGKYFLEMHIHQGVTLRDLKAHLRQTRAALDMYKSRLMSKLRECFKEKGL